MMYPATIIIMITIKEVKAYSHIQRHIYRTNASPSRGARCHTRHETCALTLRVNQESCKTPQTLIMHPSHTLVHCWAAALAWHGLPPPRRTAHQPGKGQAPRIKPRLPPLNAGFASVPHWGGCGRCCCLPSVRGTQACPAGGHFHRKPTGSCRSTRKGAFAAPEGTTQPTLLLRASSDLQKAMGVAMGPAVTQLASCLGVRAGVKVGRQASQGGLSRRRDKDGVGGAKCRQYRRAGCD